MTNVKQHTEKLQKIPRETWIAKLRKSLIGIGFIVLGVWLDKNIADLSNWVIYSCLIVGGYAVAGDIVRGLLGFAPSAIKDVRAAIKGK